MRGTGERTSREKEELEKRQRKRTRGRANDKDRKYVSVCEREMREGYVGGGIYERRAKGCRKKDTPGLGRY